VRLLLTLLESSNAIDFDKAVRSDAYANLKEFDGQNLRTLKVQQRRISARFEISDQTAHPYIKLLTSESQLDKDLDIIVREGIHVGTNVTEDTIKESPRHIALELNRYLSIAEIEGGLQLEPACSFWRIAKRAVFEDYNTVVEIPKQLSDKSPAK